MTSRAYYYSNPIDALIVELQYRYDDGDNKSDLNDLCTYLTDWNLDHKDTVMNKVMPLLKKAIDAYPDEPWKEYVYQAAGFLALKHS